MAKMSRHAEGPAGMIIGMAQLKTGLAL